MSETTSGSSSSSKKGGEKVEIHFLNGNRNTPVLFLGTDPSNDAEDFDGNKINPKQDNVLIVPLGSAVSVPREDVSDSEA